MAAEIAAGAAIGAGRVAVEFVISLDDPLHKVVAHNVVLVKIDQRNPFDLSHHINGFKQARPAVARQIDLSDVAGDDSLGVEPEAREKHLHLLAGCVLRLVEDDERIVQCAAAHEGKRCDFDNAILKKTLEAVGLKKIVQRVIKWTHVRIDFFLKRAGKKAEAFAGFDGGPGENDAVHLFRKQCGNGHGDGKVRLASSARPNREDHVEGFQRFQIKALIDALWGDVLFAGRARPRRQKSAFEIGAGFFGGDLEKRLYFVGIRNAPRGDATVELIKNFGGALDLNGRTFDFEVVIVELGCYVQAGFEQL